MLWFQKKNKTEQNNNPEHTSEHFADAEESFADKKEFGRKDCLENLDAVLSSKSKGTVLKLYIENFKRLNQVFGYLYCETLLTKIIRYLQRETGYVVYRYIGVEFIIIMEDCPHGHAVSIAEEIIERFDHVWKVEDTDCLCSAQIGLCSYPGPAGTADELLKCLDAAITKATELGQGQIISYDSALHMEVVRKQVIGQYLKTALENQEIEIRYRPTLHNEKGLFTRAEFYMRVFVQGIGMVGAGEFLPIAEDSGQIRLVEYFALHQVGRCIAGLIERGKEFDSISLPISSILLLQEDFLSEVKNVIETYQIPRGKLAIEVTENALTTAYLTINAMMQELETLGVELILNDFGTGYSSIASILELPVHTLKLERSFIWQLETNPKSRHIIEGLIDIARNLGLNIIAEGVETENQVQILKPCQYLQGFYYSPTVTEEVLMDVIGTTPDESMAIITQEKENAKR